MRDDKLYLDDISKAIERIQKYTHEMTFNKMKQDSRTVDAVVRNLEIIGEAAKHVSVSVKKKHSDIEWKKIAGLRDVLAHEYFGVDLEVLWDIVRYKIPSLKKQISEILRDQKR